METRTAGPHLQRRTDSVLERLDPEFDLSTVRGIEAGHRFPTMKGCLRIRRQVRDMAGPTCRMLASAGTVVKDDFCRTAIKVPARKCDDWQLPLQIARKQAYTLFALRAHSWTRLPSLFMPHPYIRQAFFAPSNSQVPRHQDFLRWTCTDFAKSVPPCSWTRIRSYFPSANWGTFTGAVRLHLSATLKPVRGKSFMPRRRR